MLAARMKGKTAPAQPVRVPVTGLIARKSSALVAVNHPGVAKGMKFLLPHFHEPIGVDDMAAVAAMSRRGFHQTFVEKICQPDGKDCWSLIHCCAVARQGFKNSAGRARDGSFDYYIGEPVATNDLKGIGPFVLAGIELQQLTKGVQ